MNIFWLFLVVPVICERAFDNGLGYTPQMGWNSWNKFGCDIDEDKMISTVEKMKELGLLKYGYEYIVMDDCYSLRERDPETNKIVIDPAKFPNGIKHLSDRVHELGFKFGMYSSAGKLTCAGYPGSLGNEELDAQTFADWGVDYLKYDNCFNEGNSGNAKISSDRYKTMSEALNATGRPIFYSLCQWGEDNVWDWGSTLANSWRITGDIADNFNRYDDRCPCEEYYCPSLQGYMCSMMNILEKAIPLGQKAGDFVGWNDMDSLEVGNGGMTTQEYQAHFTLWAILKSPLVMGNDVTEMSDEDFKIVTNTDIININQDPTKPGVRVWKKSVSGGHAMLFVNELSTEGSFAITVFNSGKKKVNVKVDLNEALFQFEEFHDKSFKFRELWTNETFVESEPFKVTVDSHAVKIWLIEAEA